MRSTLRQIARKAGVTEDEVLKVLNDDATVPEEIKLKVVNAVNTLTNSSDSTAEAYNERKTETVAIVTAYMSSFSFYEVYLMNGFELQNIQMGHKYSINQYSTHGNDQKKKSLSSLFYLKQLLME